MIELTLGTHSLSHGWPVKLLVGYQIWNEYKDYQKCPHVVGTLSEDPKLGAHTLPRALAIDGPTEANLGPGRIILCLDCLRDALVLAGRPL